MSNSERPAAAAPVIVPLREVARAYLKHESAIAEQAEQGPPEGGLALAALGLALKEISAAPSEEAQARVMETKQNGAVSRLQSLIAEGEAADLKLEELPTGGLEAKFDTRDVLGWATVAWAKIRSGGKHPLVRASSTPEALPQSARVALLGDWGTGLYGAPRIAQAIARDNRDYQMLMHLGDVYYSGTANEVDRRFLDIWPERPEAIHRALNSNHEMYSGGHPYFGRTLPKFKQQASYFAHRNEHWILVGLDVAHTDHAIDDPQVDWLEGIVAGAGGRKVILFSHHQLFSHHESQGTKLWKNEKFRRILQGGKIFAWYWGHEHRCCIYEERHAETGIWARCIGHGGMPENRRPTWDLPAAHGTGKNGADWRRMAATQRDGIGVPKSLVLEGTNPYIQGEEDKFLPHGYAVLNFDGPSLTEQVRDADGTVLYENDLAP